MSYKNLTIINNEKISSEENNFYCDNIDIKTIPEELNKTFQVKLIARKSKYKQVSKINLKDVIGASNLFDFLYKIFKVLITVLAKIVIYLEVIMPIILYILQIDQVVLD